MIKTIITALMFVKNVKKSCTFYEKLFEAKAIESSDKFCSFKFESTYLNFHLQDKQSPISKGGSVPYLEPEDFNQFYKRALSLGMKAYRGPLFVEETGRTICQFEDPFKNIIGIEGIRHD